MSQADNLAALGTNVNSSGVLQPAGGGTGTSTSTGTGSVVLSNSPTLVTPTLGSASATQLATGLGSAGAPALTFTGDTNTGIFSPTADTIAFSEGGVESMRIDASGNLGLGTTPAAWRSINRALQIGTVASVSNIDATTNSGVDIGSNYFFNSGGSPTYIISAASSYYRQQAGNHYWNIAPSGTAGNAITFTQAMTLDASGNLNITSPANTDSIATINSTSTNVSQRLNLTANGTVQAQLYNDSSQTILSSVTSIPLIFRTANTTRFQIGSAGQWGIGGATYGSSGQVFTSGGAGAAPSWTTITSNPGTVTSVSGTGTVNGITLTGTVTSSGNLTLGGTLSGVALGSQVSGTLPVANGGTGLSSTPTNGQLNIGNGSGFTRAALTAGRDISITNGAGSITINRSSYDVNILMVAGGGGGGGCNNAAGSGGGGGAGGVIYASAFVTAGVAYGITVGTAGAGGPAGSSGGSVGSRGGDTIGFGRTAYGGGGGGPGMNGGQSSAGLSGGSGGGSGFPTAFGGSSVLGQGSNGGNSLAGSPFGGGGGGGAGGGGGHGNSSRPGGAGASFSITGSAVTYAGGGGGGCESAAGGTGGSGGGGNGGQNAAGGNATFYGGGGGGGGGVSPNPGGSGFAGVVIVSYQSNSQIGSGGTVTTYGSGSSQFYVHTFTTNGTFTA